MSAREKALEKVLRLAVNCPHEQPAWDCLYCRKEFFRECEEALALPSSAPADIPAKQTYKVHLQQYVERVTTITVTAKNEFEAITLARRQAEDPLVSPVWEDGDDAQKVEAYAVANAAGEIIWER